MGEVFLLTDRQGYTIGTGQQWRGPASFIEGKLYPPLVLITKVKAQKVQINPQNTWLNPINREINSNQPLRFALTTNPSEDLKFKQGKLINGHTIPGTEYVYRLLLNAKDTDPVNTAHLGQWEQTIGGQAYNGSLEIYKANPPSYLGKDVFKTSTNVKTNQKYIFPLYATLIFGFSDNSIPENIMYIRKDKVFVNISQKGSLVPEELNIKKEKAKDYIDLKESLKNVINMQLDINIDDTILNSERKILNQKYENFVKKYGALNKTQNRSQIVKDRDGYLVLTLEENYKQEVKTDNKRGLKPRAESYSKADILTKRTITPQKEIQTDNSEEALIFSLNTKGLVDIDYIAKLTNKSTADIVQDLKGKIFYDNDLGYVTRDVYLTGDVKTKYANTTDEYAKEELKKVIPKDLEAKDIKTEFGQKWIDKKYFAQFLEEKAGFGRFNLSQSDITSTWYFDGYSYSFPYKASKVEDKKIVESALNSKQVRVTYKGADDKTYLDQQATDYANTQVEKLKEDFEDWIFRDTQRREYLVKKYNEVKNRYVSLDDSKMDSLIDSYSIPNLSHFEPRLHQKKAVYKAVFNNSPQLLNHTVGSGKTLTSQMIAMEWRRLGKAKKPLIATLKAVVPQYAKEFKEAYPNAKIIVPTDADFTPANRKRLLSSIATGDYDAVIITHDQLKMIENPSELQSEMIESEIQDVINAIIELDTMNDNDSKKTKRDLIKKQEALEKRYESLKDSKKDLDILSFEKLGIDGLIIDESHKFKKLAYSSSLGQIKGMPDQKGSKMAFDLYVKVQHILNTTNSKNIVFMTGTPITNTVPELYLIQKYLQNDLLKQQGISNFDSYAKDYISQSTEVEITATGGFKEVTRIKEFKNMPMLIQSTQQIIDTVTNDDIKKASKSFKLPPLKNGKPTLVFLEPTEAQLAYNEELVKRVKNITKDSPDNHLVIFNDAAKMSIDMRLISDKYKDEKNSKINEVVNSAFNKYKEFDNVKGTQLIFSDLGTPKNDKDKANIERLMTRAEEGDTDAIKELENYNDAEIDDILNGGTFSVYDDIKKKLIKKGVPSNEVVFIHDYNTKEKKIELNEEVRAGRIRFVIGSTQKLGTGINVQERLVAVHHIDIPYTPAELEQRNGRIIRQGNKLLDEIKDFNIEIFYYATKRTLDGMKWQILENKSKFIQQFFDGVSNDDIEIEEMSNSELAERMKAEASGNPLLIDKIKLEKQIKKLRNLKRGAELAKAEKRDRIKTLEVAIKEHDKNIINYEKDAQIVKDNILLIDGKNYEKATDLGNAVYDIAANLVNKKIKSTQSLGNIGEIELSISYDIYSDKVRIDFTGNSLSKIEYDFTDETPLKIANAINRKIAGYETSLNTYKTSLTNLKKEQKELLNNEDKPFEKEKELEDLVSQHSNIIQTISRQASNPNNQNNIDEENTASYMKSSDKPMPNNPERLTAKQSIRVDNKMTLRGNEILLPDKFAPMTPAKIRKQVIDIIGNRLYFSKIKQKAEGFYRKKTGETRIKEINNVEVYAHEMAHYLDFYNGNRVFRNAYKNPQFKDEVESFSYTDNKDQIGIEGFAEFVRAWLTQYEYAKEKAPNFTHEFEKILAETKLDTKMNKLQEDMHKWYNQGDEAMFSALIGDKKSKLDWLKEIIFNIKHTIMNKTLVNIFDRTHGFSVAEFTMFNKLQKAEQSPTKLLRLALGGSSATYEAVIKWGTPKLTRNGDLTFSGKGLSDIFEPVLKQGENEFKELMEYFAAVQANEMMIQGKKTPFSQSQINTILERGNQKPIYKRVFKEYQEFNDRMLNFYVDMNYLTPEDIENFKNKNSVYVPMQRVVESMGQKDGYSGGFFRRNGSDRNIREIEKNITEQLFNHIKGAMTAHAKSKLFNQLSQHEDGSLFAVKLAPDSKKVKVNIEQQAKKIVEVLYDAGMMLDTNGDIVEIENNTTLEEAINNTIDVLIMKPQLMNFISFGHKPKNTGSHIEEVIINGERKYFEIQTGDLGDILNTTLNNLGGVQYGWFMGALYSIKNFKTRVITAMPQFKLPNFVRDTLDAQVFSKTKKTINPFAGAKSYFTINDAFKNYMLNGGGYGTLLESTTNLTPKDIFEETKLQKLDRLMSFDEYANRIAVAENAIEEGNNWMEAAYQGRDLTVDFSMVGANPLLRHILKLIPFQQAGMNGMYKLVREIKDEGHNLQTYTKAVTRLSIKGFTYLTPIAIASFLISGDDDRYKALTADELARFVWFFYDKNEQPIKIPVPFGLGAIFQKFPEYIISSLFSDGDFVDNRYSDAIMFAATHQLVAVPNGGIFDPIIQDMINKKFTGSPIVTPELQKVEAPLQYTNSTPLFYKELGAATGLSPVRLEHYTKGVLGYVESAITGMTQMALWDKNKWGEMPYSSTNDYIHSTFFKQFYKMNETSRSAWSEEYYKYREKIDEAYNSVQFSNKKVIVDHGEEYEKYLSNKDKVTLTGLKKATTNIDKISADLFKAESLIVYDKNLTAKEKEAKIEELYKDKTKMFKEVYRQLNPILKDIK
jgi:N12 class adenine-specific DNA methylase